MMKKNVLAMLCAALVLSANCANYENHMLAFAEDVKSGEWGKVNWTLEDHVLTVSGNGDIYTIIGWHGSTLPSWNDYKDDIYEIILEEGITGADESAFANYPNLEKITIPSTFTELADCVLCNNPKLTEINGLEYIETFNWHCLSNTAYIAQNPFIIKNNILYYAGGTDFKIPDGVTEIKSFAFHNNSGFVDLELSATPEKEIILIDNSIYYEVILPDSVVKIDDYAFAGCSTMTNITIPASVTEIGDYAFYDCVSLNAMTLSENVVSVGTEAFYNCKSLENLEVRNPDMQFGENAFGIMTDWEATLQENLKDEKNQDYKNRFFTVLEKYPLYFDLKYWPNEAYTFTKGILTGYANSTAQTFAQEHNLVFQEIENAEDVKTGEYDNLNWTLENHVLTVSGNGRIHTNIGLHHSNLPSWDNYKDDIYEIILQEGITGADEYAFADYPNLEKITIPSTFTELDPYVLYNNPNLTEINGLEYIEIFNYRCLSDTAYTEQNPFIIKNNILYYAEGTSFEIPDGVTEIKFFAFGNCASNEFINYEEEGENEILDNCYYYSITLPDSVIKIDDFAFAGCETMTNINIPESVTEIGDYAFYNCVNLDSLTLGENLISIGKNAFFNCKSLKNLKIKNPDMQFGENAFGFVIDWQSFLQEELEKDPDFKIDIYENFLEQCPLCLDSALCSFMIEFLSARKYQDVMDNIRDNIYKNTMTQGTIIGYANSTAQTFAQENNLKFRTFDQAFEIGDVNQDGSVDILDIIIMNKAILGQKILDSEQAFYADYNADGIVTPSDTLLVMKKIVGLT
ncbi:MAG: leucine-rich repeat protein [Ruminococcus sp.]|nr:leucine-rich repeat protein [Ruminococcus sp.]